MDLDQQEINMNWRDSVHYLDRTWIAGDGREVKIHTMSSKWLRNIVRYYKRTGTTHVLLPWIKAEMIRRGISTSKKKKVNHSKPAYSLVGVPMDDYDCF